jgi:hypothetical protein
LYICFALTNVSNSFGGEKCSQRPASHFVKGVQLAPVVSRLRGGGSNSSMDSHDVSQLIYTGKCEVLR